MIGRKCKRFAPFWNAAKEIFRTISGAKEKASMQVLFITGLARFGKTCHDICDFNNKSKGTVVVQDVVKVDLYKYLNFLFEQRLSKDMSDEGFEKLAPWNESVKEFCSIK